VRPRWDPLRPDAPDLTEAHRPLDGSDGIVIGDDSDTAPQPRYRPPRGRLPWWVLFAVAAVLAMVSVLIVAPHVGGDAPDRVPAPCRCGTRLA